MKLIGVDVGGTFTDVVLFDSETNETAVHKVPTTSDDPGLSERMVHWWIEAARCAFADRAESLGDPDFWKAPIDELL
jgi:N-methylhydantoinase A/oxoprolinase/acetone carboxylase beta subunit